MEEKSPETQLKETVANLDAGRPKIDKVDWAYFDQILNNTDFTKTRNTMESMQLFYNKLWGRIIFPMVDEGHEKDKTIGRLLIAADTERRKKEAVESELKSLRESLQEEGDREA